MFYQYQHFGVSEYFCKERGKDFNFPRHNHRSFEFITVLSGSMTVSIGEKKYTLGAGEAVLIFPDQIHSLESTESEHMLVIFSPDIVRAYYSRLAGERPTNSKFAVSPYLLEQINELEAGCSTVKMKAVLYSLCALLDENTRYVKKKSTERGLLYDIFDFVENNFDGDCSLERLSGMLGYNSSYLSRYFSDATEMSFISFVNKYKISRACYLLTNTDKTVLECAYDCGYTSLRSFNRNFKMHVGVTPREYRQGGADRNL